MRLAPTCCCILLLGVSADAEPVCAVPTSGRVCQKGDAVRHDRTGASSVADPLGRGTWLIDEENDEVLLVTPAGSSRRFVVGKWPQQLVVESSGRVFVSCREAGRIDVIDPDYRRHSVEAGDEPRALALDEDAQRLYVGLVTARALLSLDTERLQPAARIELPDEPRAIALTAGGLAVASARRPVVLFFERTLQEPPVAVPLPREKATVLAPQLLVPAGDGLLLLAERARTGLEAPVSFGGYGGSSPSPMDAVLFSFNRLDEGYAPARVIRSGFRAPEPTGAVLTRGVLFVSSRGLGSLIALGINPTADAASLPLELLVAREASDGALDGFTNADGVSLASALDLTGVATGPDGQLLLTDALGRRLVRAWPGRPIFKITESAARKPDLADVLVFDGFTEQIEIRTAPLPLTAGRDAQLRAGAFFFHTANDFRISTRGVACATCHPDGREDGRVWQLTGTRRQTPMLTGRLHDTAPYNWLGTAPTLRANLTNTIVGRLQGQGLEGRELRALDRYVSEGLRPVSMPAPKEPELVALGEELFNSSAVGCATCHPADLSTTDGERHDVGSLSAAEAREFRLAQSSPPMMPHVMPRAERLPVPLDLLGFNKPPCGIPGCGEQRFGGIGELLTIEGQGQQFHGRRRRPGRIVQHLPPAPAPRRFDTPSLKWVSLSAPYFHDGAAASLEQLLIDNHDRMGNTSQLTDLERRALVAYLQTL